MALIKCSECGRDEVSDKADACPHCGFPINSKADTTEKDLAIEEEELKKEKKSISRKRISVKTAIEMGILFIIIGLVVFLLARSDRFNNLPLVQSMHSARENVAENISDYVDNYAENAAIKISNLLDDGKNEEIAVKNNPLEVQNNPDGSKIHPVHHNNLWGHEFYTSQIDQTESTDMSSELKQTIAKLLATINFPPKLTSNLVIVHVDPTLIKKGDKLRIPWGSENASFDLQPKVGTFQNVSGGAVIALNNLSGNDTSTLVHELGHLIGSQLTSQEWAQYYELRGIPTNTTRRSTDWKSIPTEDFAEVYKYAYRQGSGNEWKIRTQYGIIVPADIGDLSCGSIVQRIMGDYYSTNYPNDPFPDMLSLGEMESIVQNDPELQACRKEHINDRGIFGGPSYTYQPSEQATQFVKNIVARLR